ncbi:MAG: hypothetical protein A2Y62_07170 [Candidatus Fischerbacteria bacterium RBG_13_37_8]|uniref:Methionine synthase n=1 Tax=Candidatus Fischerbacteria bacterium RBG_13_37_8 TaxID=1817863 RepID=A0A1F5VUW3_9BACT|nr:MAG: hypothetical protein A2Y62_07170 [Candidatus Fischerbacteria bacterium RBG_13_37_8]
MDTLHGLLKKRIVILDGAMGTNLLDKGRAPGESPSLLNIKNPQAIYDLQNAYVNAGADIILTNTFGADPLHFPEDTLADIIREGVRIARRVAHKKAMVWGDVTTLGELMKPYGNLDFNEARKLFRHVFKLLYQAGVRIFFIETFTSMIEAKVAFLAASEFSKNIFVSFSMEEGIRTLMGESPESIAVTFEALGAQGIGVNCTHPDVAVEAIERMAKVTKLPLIAKPNAGKVEIIGTQVQHTISNKEMANYLERFVNAGANFVGGCCGTTTEYLKLIAGKKLKPRTRKITKTWCLTSPNKMETMDIDTICVVGERLNPSGRKKVKEALEQKKYAVYAEEARLQEENGAEALDVNAFTIDADEKEALLNAMYEVIKNSSLPVFIDTQNYEAAETLLSFYPGIGVYNSIPARKRELRKWLPMVKEYGFKAVVSLVGKKIPANYKERITNALLALHVAREIGFPETDLIVDPLVLSAATEKEQLQHTLQAVNVLHAMGIKTVLGISNVSFGLPNRPQLNAALAIAAIENGANFLIVNPLSEEVMTAIRSSRMLFKKGYSYLEAPGKKEQMQKIPLQKTPQQSLAECLLNGNTPASVEGAQILLESGTPANDIIEQYITKSLQQAGELYEKGTFYIPDLLMAAEAAQAVLAVIKPYLPKEQKKGTIILATVKGDVHDVGKNIVGAVFQSVGYNVIDLGKDVSDTRIIQAVKDHHPNFVGLSALLTTTMPEMEKVIHQLTKEHLDTRVIIGGPNISDQYAQRIGAFGAARNVAAGLRLLRRRTGVHKFTGNNE